MTKGRIIIADIEKISCKEEWILSQIAQRYVEKYQKHKRETDKKQELESAVFFLQKNQVS